MRIPIWFVALAVLLVSTLAAASESRPKVEPLRNGFFMSMVDLDGRIVKQYSVDTVARLCFASNEVIPCANLRLRDEWTNIITWVSD